MVEPARMERPDVCTLVKWLKQECLYVGSEKKLIQQLGGAVLKAAETLHQAAWIAREQRLILEQLSVTGAESPPTECCHRDRLLEDTQFVDAHTVLAHREGVYGEFLCHLRSNPRLVASCLAAGQRMNHKHTPAAIHTTFASLYGSCVTQEDKDHVLQVLRCLLELEVAKTSDPWQLLERPTCVFAHLFRLLCLSLHTARLFLTAALHEPVMQLLAQDEDHLDTDPVRLAERARLAGVGVPAEQARAAAEANEVKLEALVGHFVEGLRQSTYCFPPALRWVAAQVHGSLQPQVGSGRARATCAHLLLAYLVCPAIVSPEQYGIVSDAPVNEAARFNLRQVAHLLQQLATGKLDQAYPPWKSILLKFDKGGVTDFLDAVIGGSEEQTPPISFLDLLEGLTRTAVYMTRNQLYTLVEFVRDVTSGIHLPQEEQRDLEAVLSELPTAPSQPGSRGRLKRSSSSTALVPAPTSKKNSLPLGASLSRSTVALDRDLEDSSQDSLQEEVAEEVLVISLGNTAHTIPGMMSEKEVLALNLGDKLQGEVTPDDSWAEGQPMAPPCFTCSCDTLESVCEVQSNQSESSVEMEEESESEATSLSASCGAEALQLLECQYAATQDTPDDRLHDFEHTGVPDVSETMSDTWSTDVLVSELDRIVDDEGGSEVVGAESGPPPGSPTLLSSSGCCLLDSCAASTISEAASDSWSVEVLASDAEALDTKQEEQMEEVGEEGSSLWELDRAEVREARSQPCGPELSVLSAAGPTEEHSEDKAEELQLQYDFDTSSKEAETEAHKDDPSQHGAPPETSLCSQADVLLMFDPLSSGEGTVVRPKENSAQPHDRADALLPSPPELTQAELEQAKQRHSMPEHLGKRDSDNKACSARRPLSDPGLHRRVVLEDHRCPTGPPMRALSSHKSSAKGEAKAKRDGGGEKIERHRPWWKKRLLTKGSKGAFRKKDKQDKEGTGTEHRQSYEAPPSLAEDILDKYRHINRMSCEGSALQFSESVRSESSEEPKHTVDSPVEEVPQDISTGDQLQSHPQEIPTPGDQFSFSDAKKKLRRALYSAALLSIPLMHPDAVLNGLLMQHEENEVVRFLKVQLAEAINLQDKNRIAQIQETLRCVCRLDSQECEKLLAAIAEDYRKRAPYVAYLTRCRQGLQASQDYLERQLRWVQRDKELVSRCLTAMCVRLLLERTEDRMLSFVKAFQGFTAADEKTAAVEDFLRDLYGLMSHDATWQHASEEQLQEAQAAIERSVMNRVFKLAFYPNLDGDTLRDQVLQEHIERLGKVVTANHEALQIPQVYLKEAPWPSAQAEIRSMSAYKTPRDKVQCVTRMCSSIMNLLSLANEDSVPGADDFLPVLVFVLIKANPPYLLSTVQYIDSFYGSRLSGEESYWWMQFTAAVEFIKTIDDRN